MNQYITDTEFSAMLRGDFFGIYLGANYAINNLDVLGHWLGKPVLRSCNRIVIYDHCDWCGSSDIPKLGLYGNWICVHCGGVV